MPSSHQTSVDVLISGKPLHGNGKDQRSSPNHDKDCAGMRSGSQKTTSGCDNTRRRNAGPNVAMHSTMDQLIWGRDFDKSGADPRQHWDKFYSGFAGMKSDTDKPIGQPGRKGNYSMQAVMDEVIYGRDLDFSGSDPHAHFEKSYSEHAGRASGNDPHPAHLSARPFRKPTFSNQAVVDNIIYGHDLDGSGEDPHRLFMQHYGNHAGLKAGDATERKLRKATAVPKPVAHGLIFGGENVDPSLDSHRDYAEKYGGDDRAGRLSSHRGRTPRLRKDNGSQSQPALSAREPEASKTKVDTHLDFISRMRAAQSGSPQSPEAPQTARERPQERSNLGGAGGTPRATTPRASGSKQDGIRRSSSTGRIEVTPRRSQSTGRLGTEESPSKSATGVSGGTLRLQPGEESMTPRSPAKPNKVSPYKFKQMSRSSSEAGSLTSRPVRSLTSSGPIGQAPRWR